MHATRSITFKPANVEEGFGANINHSASSLLNRGSDGVFHAPQNLERAVMESLHAPCTI
jgi:hypothetical protein